MEKDGKRTLMGYITVGTLSAVVVNALLKNESWKVRVPLSTALTIVLIHGLWGFPRRRE